MKGGKEKKWGEMGSDRKQWMADGEEEKSLALRMRREEKHTSPHHSQFSSLIGKSEREGLINKSCKFKILGPPCMKH